jgi:hypothetical protein
MKKLTALIVACLAFWNLAIADTAVTVTVSHNNTLCLSGPSTFFGYATANCPVPYGVSYQWSYNTQASDGSTINHLVANGSGITPSSTSIPPFTYALQDGVISGVCLSVSVLDASNNPVATGEYCDSNLIFMPVLVNATVTSNNCSQNSCVVVQASGGVAPYTYLLSNGQTLSGNGYACFDTPGAYTVTVMDGMGCSGNTSFNITINGTPNGTCDQAQELVSGVVLRDTLCTFGQQFSACGTQNNMYYQTGWYHINNGDANHMQIAAASNWPGSVSGVSSNVAIEVYSAAQGANCTSAILSHCQLGAGCFDLADYLIMSPNTDFYIKVMALMTTGAPINVLATLSNLPIPAVCGCTDASSCNYVPDAIMNDGSCGYNGCTDPSACNYLQYATCDDGSCVFGTDLTGVIFNDINGNEYKDTNEPGLGGIGSLFVQETGTTIMANAEGAFVFPDLVAGTYHITYTDPSGYWMFNSAEPLAITLPTCTGLKIPVTPMSGAAINVSGVNWSWNNNLHCILGMNAGTYIQNTGAVPITGTLTLTLDPVLYVTGVTYGNLFDNFENGVATWTISLNPGEFGYYYCWVHGPGGAYAGTVFPITYNATFSDNTNVAFYNGSWSTNHLVTCSYDPNDKSANPIGYREPHFISAGQEIEYTVRFQNTGNAPAFNVLIEDQLDPTKVDLSTFKTLGASHDYTTIVESNGLVKFYFNGIMLPDTSISEPGSHGFVAFAVRSWENLSPLEELHNTASIYFDDNAPIITNDAFHTIYDCSLMADIPSSISGCSDDLFLAEAYDQYAETYLWTVDNGFSTDVNNLYWTSPTPGDYIATLIRTNPLCTATDQMEIHNLAHPDATVTMVGGSIVAQDGAVWLWFRNNMPIDGANQQSYTPTESGAYYVMITSADGCVSVSETIDFVGVNENKLSNVSAYPNPTIETLQVVLPAGLFTLKMMDTQGRVVLSKEQASGTVQLQVSALAQGTYVLRCISKDGNVSQIPVVVSK